MSGVNDRLRETDRRRRMDRREGNGEFKKKTKGKTIVFLAEDKAHEPPPPLSSPKQRATSR